ncbi:MAG: hypothetical protein LBT97_00705, partial [Planctomycetota bacterium]|nr:hypothetical protein [Planctomycetota bacterium]
ELALEETQRDIDKLVFKPDDPAAIALDLGMLPALPHFEALLKTPEGQKHLEDRWVEMQTERITGEKSNEYLLYAASAIEADDAVLAADLRRRHEDMYGGAARAAWNLGKDFVFGAERYIGQGLHGAANRVARFLAEAEPDRSGLRRRFPYGPLSVEEQAELDRQLADRGPFWEAMDWAVKATESQSRLAGDYWSRPEARTGSFVYDKALSPVAADIGSAVGAILAYSLNPALGIATMFGASKMEIYDEVLAETGDRDSAHLVSDIGGAINAILERVGIEKITAGWKPYSPGMAWFAKSVVTPFASEGITETAQSGIGSLAKEAARARQPGGEVSVGRVFKDWEKWVAEGIYGGATGGLLGAAGGGPLRAAASHIEWRRGQAYLDGMIERLSRMPGLKNAPDKIKALVNDSVRQSGAPATMFQSAEAVGVMFQDRPDLLEGYLAEADVTREEFDHAVGSNQDIEVDASGLARWQAAHQADMPDVSRLARISPDAPSMAALVAEREDMAAIAGEFNRLQRENQTLPEPFRIFREQVTDSTGDHKLAADAADMVFAMSRVAGARLGLTPEQHLNLCPIQVTPQNALERVRSSAQVMDAFDNRRLNLDISRAAQNVLMQPERGPIEETREQSVTRGVLAIERILAVLSLFRHGGKETWLLTGWEDTSPDDAEGVNPGRTYAQTPSGIQGRVGAGGIFAKYRRLWAKSSSSAASPDSTSTLIAEAGDSSGTGNAGELGTKAAIPTIPAEGTDVNAWNQSALDNLLRQSGVSEEQADIFRQYVESLLQSGEDVIDAQALGRDLTAALTSAEGLEQAAAGLERILADPASITDAVFRAAGVEAPTGQQGIAEPQRRMADPRRRADEFRKFYKSPEALSRVRQATAGDRGLLGFAQSPIETLYQEDQRPGDAARAAKIEQLKKREPLDLRGVAPVASKAAVKDVFRGFGPVINRMDGRSVIFPAKSAGKIEKHRGFDMKQIVAAFARLFADSIPMFSESEIRRKGHKPHNNIAAYHHYVSKFTRPVDNRDSAAYYIRFIVQEMKSRKGNGENLVHSAFVSDVSIYEESALSGWGWESPVIAESGASYDHKLAKWLFSVKPENDGNIDPPHQAAGAPEGARGAVTFPRFPNAPATIRLFNSRQNRSTILHELFHVYFRELERAVKAEGATDQVHADHETLNAAVDGDLTSTDPDARTAAEERAATMFERYLSEGRAPTPFLADAFARLRTW